MGRLDGKSGIVTGASSGIGHATARALAKEGARVMLADVDAWQGREVVQEIKNAGGDAAFTETDVSDDDAVARLVQATVDAYGKLDFAFNNAGIEGQSAPTPDCSMENWTRTLAVNLTGTWLSMRHEIPRMLDAGGGVIVNCASVAGLVGVRGLPAYTASKHGVVGLTRTAALEYASKGVRVNVVCPGPIGTPMLDRITGESEDLRAAIAASEPMKRVGTPEEVADAVVWLCSDGASFVTGHPLVVDGGWVAQ